MNAYISLLRHWRSFVIGKKPDIRRDYNKGDTYYCGYCGLQIGEVDRYCRECGTKIREVGR